MYHFAEIFPLVSQDTRKPRINSRSGMGGPMGGDWSEYLRVMRNLMQDQVSVSVELGKIGL